MSTTAMPAANSGNAQQMSMRDFRKNTRQRIPQLVGTLTIAPNGQVSQLMPEVGLANRVFLWFDIGVTCSASSPNLASAFKAPWGFVSRVQVVTNLGSNNVWDTSGYQAYAENLKMFRSMDLHTGLTGVTNDPLYQYPTSYTQNVQQNVRFVLVLAIAANDSINFGLGLINLQAPQIQMNVNVQTGAASTLYSGSNATDGTTTISGTCQVYYEFYQIPSPLRQVPLPSKVLHCTLQSDVGFASTGGVQYQIPRQGKLLGLMQTIEANGALLAGGGPVGGAGNASVVGVDSFQLQINNQDTVYQIPYWLQRRLARERYGVQELPAGTYLHDYFYAFGDPAKGDFRDTFDTEAVTTMIWTVNINSGVTLGSGNNFIRCTREIILPFNTTAATGGQ